MEALDFRFEIKQMPDETGTFTGLASVYGKLDLTGDVCERGCFSQTLKARPTVPILLQHNPSEPIGIGRLEDSKDGLVVHGKLTLQDNPPGRKAYALMRDGVLTGLSIGYKTLREGYKGAVRHLQEVKLFEVSLVTFPACEDALVSSVKSVDGAAEIAELRTLFWKYRIQQKGF